MNVMEFLVILFGALFVYYPGDSGLSSDQQSRLC